MSSMDVFSVVLNRYAETHAAEVCKVQIVTRRANVEVTLPLSWGANTLVSWRDEGKWKLFSSDNITSKHVYPNIGTYFVYVIGGKRNRNDSRSNRFTGFGFPELKTASGMHSDNGFTAQVTAIGTVPMRIYSISRMPRPDEHRLCMNQDQYNRLHPAAQDQMTPCLHCRTYVPSSNLPDHQKTLGDNCDGVLVKRVMQPFTSESTGFGWELKENKEAKTKSYVPCGDTKFGYSMNFMKMHFTEYNSSQHAGGERNMCFYLSCSFDIENLDIAALEGRATSLKHKLQRDAEHAAKYSTNSVENREVFAKLGGSYAHSDSAGQTQINQYVISINQALCIVLENQRSIQLHYPGNATCNTRVMFLRLTNAAKPKDRQAVETGHYTRLIILGGVTCNLGSVLTKIDAINRGPKRIPLLPADANEIDAAIKAANLECETYHRQNPARPIDYPWSCSSCTFENPANSNACQMCRGSKPGNRQVHADLKHGDVKLPAQPDTPQRVVADEKVREPASPSRIGQYQPPLLPYIVGADILRLEEHEDVDRQHQENIARVRYEGTNALEVANIPRINWEPYIKRLRSIVSLTYAIPFATEGYEDQEDQLSCTELDQTEFIPTWWTANVITLCLQSRFASHIKPAMENLHWTMPTQILTVPIIFISKEDTPSEVEMADIVQWNELKTHLFIATDNRHFVTVISPELKDLMIAKAYDNKLGWLLNEDYELDGEEGALATIIRGRFGASGRRPYIPLMRNCGDCGVTAYIVAIEAMKYCSLCLNNRVYDPSVDVTFRKAEEWENIKLKF